MSMYILRFWDQPDEMYGIHIFVFHKRIMLTVNTPLYDFPCYMQQSDQKIDYDFTFCFVWIWNLLSHPIG